MDIDLNGECGNGDQQQQQSGAGAGAPGGGGQPDLTADLLQKFSCMNTTDRDVLVEQLKRLLGQHINDESAVFWLDMNNWNLQAAICSYFDYEQPPGLRLPSMKLISDVTIGEGEEVPPNTKFTKTWRIANSGDDCWPTGCCLRFTDGDQMCHNERVLVDSLGPAEFTDIAVDMISPQKPGFYSGQWRMSTSTGQFFGEEIWVIISVSEGGVLSVTQQMSRFNELGSSTPFGSSQAPVVNSNPFAANNSIQTHLVNNRFEPQLSSESQINDRNENNCNYNQNQNSNHFSTDESMPNSEDNDGWG